MCKNFGPEDYSEDAEFRCATSDGKGTIYFGTNYGILVFKGEKKASGKNWRFMLLPQPDVVLSLYMDTAARRLYVSGQNDFGYFKMENYLDGEFVSLKGKMKAQSSEVWHIEKCGNLVFYHSTNKLMIYGPSNDVLSEIYPMNNGIFHNMFKISEKAVALNGLGLGWFCYTTDRSALQPLTDAALPQDKCYSVLRGKNGSLTFFFRNSGVYTAIIKGNEILSPKKISDESFDKFLSESQIYSACYSADSSKFIIGTLNSGAYLVENGQQLTLQNVISKMQNATSVMSVYGLFTDPLQNIWILGKRNLSELPSDLSLLHESLKGITIRSLALCGNSLYVASGSGLYKLNKAQGLFSQPELLKEGSFIKVISVGDTIYACTTAEIICCTGKTVTSTAAPIPVNDLCVVRGHAWISTQNGLFAGINDLLHNSPVIKDKNVLQAIGPDGKTFALINNEGVIELGQQNELIGEYKLNKDFTSTQNAKLFANGGVLVSNLFDTYVLDPSTHSFVTGHKKSRLWMYKMIRLK